MSATDDWTESSPLIQEAETDTHSQDQQQTNNFGWNRGATRTASLAATFLVLYAFADILKYISTVRLIELGICREHYLQNGLDSEDYDNIPEHLCKLPSIQQRLAHLRGSLAALEAIVGLALTLPYGLLIYRLGERLVAGINVVGYLLSCAWIIVVCYYWHVFPIWSAVLAPLFRIIGGGSPILSSVIYSIAAKSTPNANRSLCFFFFMAAQLLTEIFAIMVAAQFLDHGFLFTPTLLNFPVGLMCLITLFIIHPGAPNPTDPLPRNEYESERGRGTKVLGSMRASSRILSELLHDRNVRLLLATVPVAKLVNPITELMLQYIPKKFDLSLASASRALSIQAIESLILLIIILPILKNVSQVRFRVVPTKVDLIIVQYGFAFMSIGCLIMALSQTLIYFVFGLLVFTLGCSTRPALQSILTDLVNGEHIPVLYAIIAVNDGIGSAAGAFILNRTFAIAIGWDNWLYLGLPFVIGAYATVQAEW
ncbi:mfs transporter [Trichoderma arundinaceum]|uniref:Mfs transporter n=1 Tax=Trichoderma arundinaceum TaxID=490622 RepID=A0A395P0P4_TRIAR|nr:mfs transporter [Trichoderma arundinaceum]